MPMTTEDEEKKDIYLTQIHDNNDCTKTLLTEPGCQKTLMSTMLDTHNN